MAIYSVCHNQIMELFSLLSCLFDYKYFTPFVCDEYPIGSFYVRGLEYCKCNVA